MDPSRLARQALASEPAIADHLCEVQLAMTRMYRTWTGESAAVAHARLASFLRQERERILHPEPNGRSTVDAVAASCVAALMDRLADVAEETMSDDTFDGGAEQSANEPSVRELYRAVRTRERILAVVSHDLRDPLAAVTSGALLLERHLGERAEPRVRRLLATIQRNARHMERLIRDLLDMASVRTGRVSVTLRRCSLNALMQEAATLHEPAASAKKVALALRAPDEDESILCDEQRILQLLSNLLGNAIKFCRAGDLVEVVARIADGDVELSVRDTGPGIAAEDLTHVFEPYWSADRNRSGTGLGLHIVRAIAEAHRGRVRVESSSGRGTTFFVTLPVASDADSA